MAANCYREREELFAFYILSRLFRQQLIKNKTKIFCKRAISGGRNWLREATFNLSRGSAEHFPFNSNLTIIRIYCEEMGATPLISGEKKMI